ncbi:MAG TPA: hypothetical protein VGC67_15990 [Cellulomonas sp.]
MVSAGQSLQVQVQVQVQMQMAVALPVEAGNEYQGLTATGDPASTATALVDGRCPGQDGGTDDGSGALAVTGCGVPMLAGAVVVALVAAGIVLRLSGRRAR